MLDADSRITGDIDAMSAVGWEQSFHNVSAELNLPPGWRLLAARGVDNVPDSWISRWTLLDLFLVLITALAQQDSGIAIGVASTGNAGYHLARTWRTALCLAEYSGGDGIAGRIAARQVL